MTLTKMQAMLGAATIILTITSVIGGAVASLESHFAALDTRLGKLESAIRTMNVTTPDERYRELVKELIAQERSESIQAKKANAGRPFGGKSVFPADAGAAADLPAGQAGAPAVKVPQ